MNPPHGKRPRPIKPETIRRLRKRLRKRNETAGLTSLLLATRALVKSPTTVDPIKMTRVNARGAWRYNTYNYALQVTCRRMGIASREFIKELKPLLFDIARTPVGKNVSENQTAILEKMDEIIFRHHIPIRKFQKMFLEAAEELNQ